MMFNIIEKSSKIPLRSNFKLKIHKKKTKIIEIIT